MRFRLRATLLVATLAMGLMLPAGALPLATPLTGATDRATDAAEAEDAISSDTMEFVANIPYRGGTDIEFATIEVAAEDGTVEAREFAFAGTLGNGLQIVDITDPENAELAAVYDCGVSQGDVQVFTREEGTFVTYTQDTGYGYDGGSQCYMDAERMEQFLGSPAGTFIVDVSDPYDPQTVSFIHLAKGSHNQTVHPSGEYMYNSNSELITNVRSAAIEVIDISDLANPEQVTTLPLPPRPGLGTDSHDITFNTDGTRAYSAALSQTVIINTEDPAAPTIVSSFMDPAINVEHQSNPITIDDPILGEREFLIVEDELAGAAGAEPACPSGGVHVYDITDELELAPLKVGYWNISDIRPTTDALHSCTAHVFQLHEEAALMTIAFYNGGTRVVDISGLVGVALGEHGVGMREVGYLRFDDSNAWAAKTPAHLIGDGTDFYIYANDIDRGLDIIHFTADGAAATEGTGQDSWLSPTAALQRALATPRVALSPQTAPYCLLR
jgi:hypothetical protein